MTRCVGHTPGEKKLFFSFSGDLVQSDGAGRADVERADIACHPDPRHMVAGLSHQRPHSGAFAAERHRRGSSRAVRQSGAHALTRAQLRWFDSALDTERTINDLLGKDVSARFRCIMERAAEVKELDV